MYESFLRPPSDPWFQPDSVTWHQGSRQQFLTRARRRLASAGREGKTGVESLGAVVLKLVADARMLRASWNLLAAKGDTAPGPNGRRYEDLEDPEVWALLKAIGRAIRKDTFRPGAERVVAILKDRTDPTRGTRPISLINIEDRVVQRTAVEVLQPLLDPVFGRNILGYRPGLGRLHSLALAEREAAAGDRYVLVAEDIADAFTHVPVQRLLDVLAVYIPSTEMVRLLRRLLDTGRKHGIRQGGPLSPLLLNVYLHHILDEPWRKTWASVPMIRVADDILLLCRTRKEAQEARAGLATLLTPARHAVEGRRAGHDLRPTERRTRLLAGVQALQSRCRTAGIDRAKSLEPPGRIPHAGP